MDLTLTSDQEQLLGSIVACLDGELPVSRLHEKENLREAAEVGRVRTLGELGWYRISLPEALGGAGLGLAEEALLFRELGRRLAPIASFTAVLAGQLAAKAGDAALAEDILSGERLVAFSVPEVPVEIGERDLEGVARLFSTAPTDFALLCTPTVAVLLDVSGAPSNARPCLDRTLTMRSADLAGARIVARLEGAETWNHGLVLLAATLTGQAEAARDLINAYAKVRTTFGRPIGAYQAVRHPIAEMAARCEQSRCLALYAALALDDKRPDAGSQASAARAIAQIAATRNDDSNIQLHGGIGVTDDLDAHLYLKRTTVYGNWFGGKQHVKALLDAPLGEI